MKKSLRLLTCLFFVSYCSFAQQQAPYLQWQESLGGSNEDQATCVHQTKDGGYIIGGVSKSNDKDVSGNHGDNDYWIVKLKANGKIDWQKSFGGSGADVLTDIKQTNDEGYIVAGYTNSDDGDVSGNHGGKDYWILKLGANGGIKWKKCYGGTDDEIAYSIQQTSDGGFVVAGATGSIDGDITYNHNRYLEDYWIVKLDASGSIQWQKCYGGSDGETASSIQQTTDKGFIIAGAAESKDGDVRGHHDGYFGSYYPDYWVIKIDSIGHLLWSQCYGGKGYDAANGVQQTNDGGYIVAGSTDSYDGDVSSNHGFTDYWVIKLNTDGSLKWSKTYGGSFSDYARSVQQTSDSGYVVAGISGSRDGDIKHKRGINDFFIIKLDATGDVVWEKSLGGKANESASSVQQTNDGGFIIAGYNTADGENVTGNNSNDMLWGEDYWVTKLSPETLNKDIRLQPGNTTIDCDAVNSISCILKNREKSYTVLLYRYGILFDSALNVTNNVTFQNLKPGSFYAAALQGNTVTYSDKLDIFPKPRGLKETSITSTSAYVYWHQVYCSSQTGLQYHALGTSTWIQDKIISVAQIGYFLKDLKPATAYVWRIASEFRQNGIKGMGKFSDSATFTTASANSSAIIASTLNSNQLAISPNPAKNSFKILFNTTSSNKVNAMLYDVNGKAVWSSGLINAPSINNKTISTTLLARGVYYLKLMDEKGNAISSKKVIVAN